MLKQELTAAELRRWPEGAMVPPEGENNNKKGAQIAILGAQITETTWKWPWTTISEGAKIVRPPQKTA